MFGVPGNHGRSAVKVAKMVSQREPEKNWLLKHIMEYAMVKLFFYGHVKIYGQKTGLKYALVSSIKYNQRYSPSFQKNPVLKII